ncbi:hypothetical protein D4R42_01290 [bacterium]|nr:MAG: hypothetical protein D4R42_01290 [bacterium]
MLDEDHYSCKCGYEISVLDVLNKLVKLESRHIPSTKEIVCDECGNRYEKSIQIEKLKCPKCGQLMEEVMIEDESTGIENFGGCPEIMGSPYKRPLHSDALGIQPDQVEEHRRQFPDIEIDDENRPVFTHMRQHQDYMDKCGIVKLTSSNKKRGTIYSIPGTSCHRGRDLRN